MIREALRDPLAHFLIAGAAIWGVLALAGDPVDPAGRSIELSREKQAGLALRFERMMGRAPTDAELDAQIANWVREEILYREALRLGLDDGDPLVRRRLAAKMDELAAAQAEMVRPDEETLRDWYRDNGGQFETGGVLNFEQAWYPSEEAALAAKSEERPRGEPISLPRTVVRNSPDEIAKLFGSDFAQEVTALRSGPGWQGPVRSGYGWHLVHLYQREEGRIPPFEEVREAVERDWRSRTIQARREKAYQLLRDAYEIDIE
ncbi:peptidyl-prolyl cis-trans isomerase [Qipengyuania sphaerica]|uniref:peptidylprolyl isomerase n=1 Tax=Qipengyuania sphaerica TaxID=2867243 RepID=UPI001C884440|nr:peptidylprolyl isomerase [Qipengyuania sphaerica]MBX7539688.1 peptidyl-prolyl cis-trans isomerase [Qipengyuania sphaerica]